jgi:hypothetical protein
MQNDRENDDWLSEFVRNSAWGEAPQHMYFWVGVATIAATLRRRVWLDMGTFDWYPNLYTLLVAPPGVIAKSTTADLGFTRILKKVPGINFGPATLTWQSIYDAFVEVGVEFEVPGEPETFTEFSLAILSSEFGITLNPKDTEMIDQLVHIWDGREMRKRTRKDGDLTISTPCLNLIACTTPSWIAENVPKYLIGGGLTSRMLFVYAEEKVQYIAYPGDVIPPDYKERNARLIRDLERISLLSGKFTLTKEAKEWGKAWYEHFHKVESKQIDATILGGYIARKQTLVHKVAMCLAVSQSNSLVITLPILERAVKLITHLEAQMPLVYSRIGMSPEANAAETVIEFLKRYNGSAPFTLLYRYMHKTFPNVEEFETVITGMIEAGYVTIDKKARTVILLKDQNDKSSPAS